jgi:hypothetical protein
VPSAVAIAKASFGFFRGGAELGDASVVCVIRPGSIVCLVVIFAENGLGNDIFLGGPVSQVLHLAAFATKRELGMNVGVGRLLTNRTAVLHGLASSLWSL